MKRISIFSGILTAALVWTGCSEVRRDPGTVYMPDMNYSRAYETYASTGALKQAGVNYTATPVSGTIAKGEAPAYPYRNDSVGYAMSAGVKNPLDPATVDLKEAERLYLVNCGICHGKKLDGNGPLWNDGNGPYPSKPIALVGDEKYEAMAAGTMFHSLTYGKNAMGSYASQLSTKQRWMVITYIKDRQGATSAGAETATKPL